MKRQRRQFLPLVALRARCSSFAPALISGLLVLGFLPAQSQQAFAQGQTLTFGLIGDLAYNPAEEPLLQNVLDDLNKTRLAFVVHLGDLSSPRFACTDELLTRRLAQFRASAHPLVFTPGDNDWTDCHPGQNVAGADPLDRLAKVRSMFFVGEQGLGRRTMALVPQSRGLAPMLGKDRENGRWAASGAE